MGKIIVAVFALVVSFAPIRLYAQSVAPTADQQILLDLAEKEESIRIIVGFRLPTKSITWEDAAAIKAYREEIVFSRNALLERHNQQFDRKEPRNCYVTQQNATDEYHSYFRHRSWLCRQNAY